MKIERNCQIFTSSLLDEDSRSAERFFPKAKEFLDKNEKLCEGSKELQQRLDTIVMSASPLTSHMTRVAGDS